MYALSIGTKIDDLGWPHWLLNCCNNGEIQLSNDSDDSGWLDALYLLRIRPTYSCADALTYLFTYTVGWKSIKPAMSPKRLKIERKLLVHWLSIAAKMYDLEWREIQGHWFLKFHKKAKYSLVMTPTPCRVAGSIISIRPTYSCTGALTYLLTQLARGIWNQQYLPNGFDKAKVTINGLYKVVLAFDCRQNV